MPPRIRALGLPVSALLAPHASSLRLTPLLAPFLLPGQQRFASILSQLSDNPGAYNKRIRLGRGPSSGKGKTSGRGQKGQHARGTVPAGFQGGQTPLEITSPPRGRNKYNPFTVAMSPINLDRIQSWIDQGRLNPEEPITMKELAKSRCLHGVKRHGVKLLARNANLLTSKINIIVGRASTQAIAAIEALGGTVTTRFYSPTSIRRVLKNESHPTISLLASPELIARAGTPQIIASLHAAQNATASQSTSEADAEGAPTQLKNEAMRAVMAQVGEKYKYRLPDATGRKDMEYYRDPAHRGYLAYTVKENESPSLFFKPPGEAKDRKKQMAKRQAAKASADNRLF